MFSRKTSASVLLWIRQARSNRVSGALPAGAPYWFSLSFSPPSNTSVQTEWARETTLWLRGSWLWLLPWSASAGLSVSVHSSTQTQPPRTWLGLPSTQPEAHRGGNLQRRGDVKVALVSLQEGSRFTACFHSGTLPHSSMKQEKPNLIFAHALSAYLCLYIY